LVEKNAALKDKTLEQIVRLSHGKEDLTPVFNNAGQHLNHSVFWNSLSPAGGGIPGNLERKLSSDFGGIEKFREAFKTAALGQFGSGWAWLVLAADGRLKITKTSNAGTPLATGDGKALLVLDVWEHAYYVDFRNRRPDFTDNFLAKLANYEYAAQQLNAA
jgi:Fe-Mn family superoxide dismutase